MVCPINLSVEKGGAKEKAGGEGGIKIIKSETFHL